MLQLEIDMNFHMNKNYDRHEAYNVRNKLCQETFYQFTSKGSMFTDLFYSNTDSVDIQFKRWQRLLNKAINVCFKKRKIRQEGIRELSNMDVLINNRKK